MEVKIGLKTIMRELIVESGESPEEVTNKVAEAIRSDASLLTLVDEKGGRVLIPVDALAYIEIAATEARRVGFGAA